jgi:S1-C subfamily serine protease
MVQERYLSPDRKYAVEIVGEGRAFARSQVFVGSVSATARQLLGDFDLPVQGSPVFFDDNRVLVLHTGSLSSGTWPVVFLRNGVSVFARTYEFDQKADFDALKAMKKLPVDYRMIHLYLEVTGFLEPDILKLTFRGDSGWSAFKPVALDFSLTTKKYLDTDRAVSSPLLVPRMAGQALAGYGTGFFVNIDGWILTCNHVVSNADLIKVLVSTGETLPAVRVAQDPEHDLALLRISARAPAVVPIPVQVSATLGDQIYTLGFPTPSLQGFNPKLTSGIINSLTGIMDNPHVIQISAPIQPGNSGGAVISIQGSLIGVASSSVKPEAFLGIAGTLPQNINYAVRTEPVQLLLDRQRIAPENSYFEDSRSAIQNLTESTVLILIYSLPDTLRQTEI